MPSTKDKTAQRQVSDAGFAAAVRAKGYEQISPVRWRLEGDGIIHHLMLRPGPRDRPNSFRDFEAVSVPEVDRMIVEHDLVCERPRLPRSQERYHYGGNDAICWEDYHRQKAAWEENYPPMENTWKNIFLYLIGRIKERPDFHRHIYRTPDFFTWHWPGVEQNKPGHWTLEEGKLEEVTRSVIDTWERSAWPVTESLPSWQAYYEKYYRQAIEDRETFSATYMVYAYLGGDHHLIQAMLDKEAELVGPPLDEAFEFHWKHCLRVADRKRWKKHRHTPEGLRMLRGLALSSAFGSLESIREAAALAEKLGLPVTMPDVDFTELDATDWDEYVNRPYSG